MDATINNSKIFNTVVDGGLPIDTKPKYNNKPYIPFGVDNLFPQQAARLSREAVNHRAIMNSKTVYCEGKDFQSDDERLLQFIEDNKLKDIVYHNALYDYFMDGNGWIEWVKNAQNDLIKVYHQDTTKVRRSEDVRFVMLHPDWKDYKGIKDDRTKEVAIYPNWSKGDDGLLHSIVQISDYEPEFTYYGVPGWIAGLRSANIAKKTNQFNDERLDNKFSIDGMLFVPGVDSIEDAKKIDLKLTKYQGSKNAGKLFTHYQRPLGAGEQKEKPEFIPFNQSADGLFMDLHRQSDQDMIKIHSWYRSLAAFEEATGFDTQRILNDYNMAFVSTISVVQNKFLSILNPIFEEFGFKGDLTIFNEPPLYTPSKVELVWEVRKRKGLSYDENDERQQMYYSELEKGTMFNTGGFNG